VEEDSTIIFSLYGKDLTNETLQGFGNCKVGGQVICTEKYAVDLVLLAKEETILQHILID